MADAVMTGQEAMPPLRHGHGVRTSTSHTRTPRPPQPRRHPPPALLTGAERDNPDAVWPLAGQSAVCVRPTAVLPRRAAASGPTGRKGWGSAEVKETTQWKRRRSLLRAPVPVLPHAAIGSVNPARRALLSASRGLPARFRGPRDARQPQGPLHPRSKYDRRGEGEILRLGFLKRTRPAKHVLR